MTGGGKFDSAVKELREKVGARGVVAIIIMPDGKADFEIQIGDMDARHLPGALRQIASQVEADLIRLTTNPKQGQN